MELVKVNKINLTYPNDIVNKQNISQDVIKKYINYSNLISSTTNKKMKYDSMKDTAKVIIKVIMLYQKQKDVLSIVNNFNLKGIVFCPLYEINFFF